MAHPVPQAADARAKQLAEIEEQAKQAALFLDWTSRRRASLLCLCIPTEGEESCCLDLERSGRVGYSLR